jgi:energy-coupling factor transporter ATP-binding protein EcfA2
MTTLLNQNISTICPYPGLRPFNEEESIFFKGREQQVERLVKRLEEKKFLMVNGASGNGKSSLICRCNRAFYNSLEAVYLTYLVKI